MSSTTSALVTRVPDGPPAPPTRTRILIAIGLGLFAAAISWFATHRPGFGVPDFHWWWVGARALLDGQNPYEVVPRVIGSEFRLFHPMPAMLVTLPLAYLPPDVALSLFSAISTAVLAYVVTRYSYHLLPLFLSASFAHAAVMGQWSLILTAAMLVPWLAFLGAVKPNVGIAMLGASLSWRAAAAMVAIVVISLALMPTWPKVWLAQLSSSPYHFSPLRTPIGFLTLAALARWRRPEARLLAVLGVVPQSPFVYEVLPLFLIPRTRFQSYALVIGSDLALGVYLYTRGMDTSSFYRYNGLAIVIGLYLPALWMVLRRPNEGAVPAWLERASALLPSWLRGRAPVTEAAVP
jgi:hypothetical protein